jgi:hypothetical protein
MPEGPFAREALVAGGDDLAEAVILEGFANATVAVQEGPLAVGAGRGSVGGGSVDGGDREAYLHGVAALLSASRNDLRTTDSTSEVRRCYFGPPPTEQLRQGILASLGCPGPQPKERDGR